MPENAIFHHILAPPSNPTRRDRGIGPIRSQTQAHGSHTRAPAIMSHPQECISHRIKGAIWRTTMAVNSAGIFS